jgi:hypothetical protein
LPRLVAGRRGSGAADIDVVYGITPAALAAPLAGERHWQAEPNRLLYRMGRFGRYLVEDGCRITVTRRTDTEDADICFHLLYVCLAIALQQRGLFVLHANTVRLQGKAVTFAGLSGAGKSTLLAALVAEGHAMLADDVTVIDAPPTGPAVVRPGFPHYKLCLDAAARLGADEALRTPVRWRREKVGIQAGAANFVDEPTPLAAIFLLEQHAATQVVCTPVTGIDKFAALRTHTYGPDGMGALQAQSRAAMQVAARVPVYRLARPQEGWSLEAVLQQVKQRSFLLAG